MTLVTPKHNGYASKLDVPADYSDLFSRVGDVHKYLGRVGHISEATFLRRDLICDPELVEIRAIRPFDPNVQKLDEEGSCDIAAYSPVGLEDFLDFMINEKVVRVNVPILQQ